MAKKARELVEVADSEPRRQVAQKDELMVLRLYEQTSVVQWPFTPFTSEVDKKLRERGCSLLSRIVDTESEEYLDLVRRYISPGGIFTVDTLRSVHLPQWEGLRHGMTTFSTEEDEILPEEITLYGFSDLTVEEYRALVPHNILLRNILDDKKSYHEVKIYLNTPLGDPNSRAERETDQLSIGGRKDLDYCITIDRLTDPSFRKHLAKIFKVKPKEIPLGSELCEAVEKRFNEDQAVSLASRIIEYRRTK